MKINAWVLALSLATLAAAGCSDDDENPPPAGTEVLLVVNSLGETLDMIETATGTLEGGVVLGSAPNDVVVDQEAGLFYVANSLDNEVRGYDLADLEPRRLFDLGANSSPFALGLLGDKVLVTNWVGGYLAYLGPGDGDVAPVVLVGRGPQAILTHDGLVFVTVVDFDIPTFTYGKGEVVRVTSGAVSGRVAVGTNPQDLLVDDDGRIHVICTGNYDDIPGRVLVIDPTSLARVDSLEMGGTPSYAAKVGDKVYVTGFFGGMQKYDAATLEIERGADDPILDGISLGPMTYDGDSNRLYIPAFSNDAVYVVDTTADTLVATWDVGDGPVATALARVPESE